MKRMLRLKKPLLLLNQKLKIRSQYLKKWKLLTMPSRLLLILSLRSLIGSWSWSNNLDSSRICWLNSSNLSKTSQAKIKDLKRRENWRKREMSKPSMTRLPSSLQSKKKNWIQSDLQQSDHSYFLNGLLYTYVIEYW